MPFADCGGREWARVVVAAGRDDGTVYEYERTAPGQFGPMALGGLQLVVLGAPVSRAVPGGLAGSCLE